MSGSAGSVTAELLAPPATPVGAEARDRLSDLLVDGVAAAVAGLAPGGPVEVTLSSLRRARSHPAELGEPGPAFAWKPVFVRRSLGLAAVRACIDGRFRAPAEAVVAVAGEAVEDWRRTGSRSFHWEPWFAGLGSGARAVVLADAVTWASGLWTAVEWTRIGPRAVLGAPDVVWACPAPHPVRLRGRSEVTVDLGGPHPGDGRTGGATALVTVSGGSPREGWTEELAFPALVAAVRSPHRPVPARVLGLWPDSGDHRVVEVDGAVLGAAARRVVSMVADTADARAGHDPTAGTTGDRDDGMVAGAGGHPTAGGRVAGAPVGTGSS